MPSMRIKHYLYPMNFELQLGNQLTHPREIDSVSNWGE
ncbi:hypothetical protein SESI111939_01750 [Serratia silvae]